ncbi:hypothetical protein L1987_71013 [Smallanthus sonchifolius]|uniref:Uncharacterized protein n=1 Tax=Smallanthus sonchifolius TaxID=185202 RepID=A0ACB9ARX2_9ASTR|nr:hypothetical protein L1987_71013 [Smallanthus sonchifolius]
MEGTIEGSKRDSEVNEEILLLEFFQTDSDAEEEAEKIECLDDLDDLFDDVEDDIVENEVEEGEIVEIEIEKSKVEVTYEGCDGLNVPYNFIQDDVIPEFSNEEVTNSMDSVEDLSKLNDTAQSKVDTETDTTHSMSSKSTKEHVMYRDIGMTKEQWKEVVNSWKKELPKSPTQPAQKERYVNKERCVGRIISWFYDEEVKLFALKRSDGVQYLKPRIKYFNTLPRCEMNGLATKPLINRSKFGLADVISKLISREGGSGDYQKLKPQRGKRVKIVDLSTGNMKWWYVDVNTGEARVEDRDNKVIVRFYDAMDLINFSKKDQRTLRKNEIMFTKEWREQGLQYKRVLEAYHEDILPQSLANTYPYRILFINPILMSAHLASAQTLLPAHLASAQTLLPAHLASAQTPLPAHLASAQVPPPAHLASAQDLLRAHLASAHDLFFAKNPNFRIRV